VSTADITPADEEDLPFIVEEEDDRPRSVPPPVIEWADDDADQTLIDQKFQIPDSVRRSIPSKLDGLEVRARPTPSASPPGGAEIVVDAGPEDDAFGGERSDEVPAVAAYPDIRAELDELDFYLDQDITSEAQSILEELASRYPDHPEIVVRLLRLKELR
jgi:hypothetical protein